MSRPVEGVLASYVGHSLPSGAQSGNRCLILSDEGSTLHVRWVTGTAQDAYDALPARSLVPDVSASHTAVMDEFGFEPGRATRDMAINVQGVFDRGGDVALFEAMESEGHLDSLRTAAARAVKDIRRALANDSNWDEVRRALASDAGDVERSAIIAAVIAAAESDDPVSTEFDEEGFDDGFLD